MSDNRLLLLIHLHYCNIQYIVHCTIHNCVWKYNTVIPNQCVATHHTTRCLVYVFVCKYTFLICILRNNLSFGYDAPSVCLSSCNNAQTYFYFLVSYFLFNTCVYTYMFIIQLIISQTQNHCVARFSRHSNNAGNYCSNMPKLLYYIV